MTTDFKIIFTTAIIIIFNQVDASNKNYVSSNSLKIMESDLPSHKDLPGYFTVLERIINFSSVNKRDLTAVTAFGLFLVNVNLRPFVDDDGIPLVIRNRIKQILAENDKTLKQEYNIEFLKNSKNIFVFLFTNDTAWSKRITKLNPPRLRKYGSHQRFPEWNIYRRVVDEYDSGVPTPHQSGVCLARLAESVENLSKYPFHCEIPEFCYKVLSSGTQFGYWLTHRLLLLLFARLSRGCVIFSFHQDEHMRKSFCQKAYREAEHNAFNGFQIVDLILEQTALCTLDGHSQFLRKSWLKSYQNYQHELGCFNLRLFQGKTWFSENMITAVECSPHVTTVAAATYAAAIRYILENE